MPIMRALSYSALAFFLASGSLFAAARTFDGHPDLSGIWQTMSTANWDLQDHPAAAGPFFQLGAVGSTPSGQGFFPSIYGNGSQILQAPGMVAIRYEMIHET